MNTNLVGSAILIPGPADGGRFFGGGPGKSLEKNGHENGVIVPRSDPRCIRPL